MRNPIEKELTVKLRDKLSTVQQFIAKCTALLQSEQIISDPGQLEQAYEDVNHLLLEFDDLEVHTKMISDWSAELSKSPNPSSSVDEANALEEQLITTQKQLESKRLQLGTMRDAWVEQEKTIIALEERVTRIQNLVAELEGSFITVINIVLQ